MTLPISHRRLATLLTTAALVTPPSVHAGMDAYLGEMLLFAGSFCPKGSMAANGQLLSIAQNSALYSLLGVTYGGDGRTTFALPDLRGRVPVGYNPGGAPAVSQNMVGESAGSEQTILTYNQMPQHIHGATFSPTAPRGSTLPATHATPAADRVPAQAQNAGNYRAAADADIALGGGGSGSVTVQPAGGSQPMSLRNPYLVMTWCIYTQGAFPPRD